MPKNDVTKTGAPKVPVKIPDDFPVRALGWDEISDLLDQGINVAEAEDGAILLKAMHSVFDMVFERKDADLVRKLRSLSFREARDLFLCIVTKTAEAEQGN